MRFRTSGTSSTFVQMYQNTSTDQQLFGVSYFNRAAIWSQRWVANRLDCNRLANASANRLAVA